MALVLCLLLMTTLCLVGGAALSVSGLNQKIVHNARKQTQAFYAAEAGRELAEAHLKADPLWRGEGDLPISGFCGTLDVDGIECAYEVAMFDRTDDEIGIFDALLPAGYVMVECTGTYLDALQAVSCLFRITPAEGSAAAFPMAVVVSSGSVSGPLTPLDELGVENSLLIHTDAALPGASTKAMQAVADTAFSVLDNDAWDTALADTDSFWGDAPADTQPRILYVQGDLKLSGDRRLYGIVFVAGSQVVLAGDTEIVGVLYAPNAAGVTIQNTGIAGRIVVDGQIVAGPGGVEALGNPVSIRLRSDFVDAFNLVAGAQWNVEMVSGSWTSF
jgi:hypothetical protein